MNDIIGGELVAELRKLNEHMDKIVRGLTKDGIYHKPVYTRRVNGPRN